MVMTAARGINQPTIGIVGHSQAGKSTFLAVLLKAFQQRGYRVTPENPENGAYRDLLENHVNLGFFPPKTPVDNEENRISLRISHESLQRRGTDGIVLDFFDPAGDVFERDPGAGNSEDERTRNLNTRNLILKRLEQCTGLIVVMDIHASPELLSQVFRTTVEDLCGRLRRAGNKDRISDKGLTMPVVILFTKADSLAWQQRHRVRNAEDWIREQPRFRDLVSVASTYCSRVYFAFCSAAGWRDGRPNLRTLVRPRPLPGRAASDGADKLNEAATAALAEAERHLDEYQGEHIPDPALSPDGIRHAAVATHDTPAALRFMANLPMFTDPLRLVTAKSMAQPIENFDKRSGVINLYGASRVGADQSGHTAIVAWNIVEPVLWAAGLAQPSAGRGFAPAKSNRPRKQEDQQ